MCNEKVSQTNMQVRVYIVTLLHFVTLLRDIYMYGDSDYGRDDVPHMPRVYRQRLCSKCVTSVTVQVRAILCVTQRVTMLVRAMKSDTGWPSWRDCVSLALCDKSS